MAKSQDKYAPTLREVLGALSGAFFAAWLLQLLLEWTSALHWSVGAVMGAAASAGIVWISLKARTLLGHTPIGFITVALSFGTVALAAIGGWLSFTLYSIGLAEYSEVYSYSVDGFVRLYLYTVIDLLPALEVWETLAVDPPAKPANAWAGAPLVVFKVFVIWLVLDTFNRWWKM